MVVVIEDMQSVASGGVLKIKPSGTNKWSVHNIYAENSVTIIKCQLTSVTGENVGTGDGTTTQFTLGNIPVEEYSETVKLNGVAQTRDTDYTINYETGTITFTTAPGNGVSITADYQYRNEITVDSATGANSWLNFAWYVVETDYLRIKNDHTASIKIGYDGVLVGT